MARRVQSLMGMSTLHALKLQLLDAETTLHQQTLALERRRVFSGPERHTLANALSLLVTYRGLLDELLDTELDAALMADAEAALKRARQLMAPVAAVAAS